MKTYIFHGPSGSGKDTQVDMLADYLDMEKISTGNMYRELPAEGDPMAIEWSKRVFSEGIFPSGEITYALFKKYIKRFDITKDWLFVSIIRLVDQLPYYEEMMKYTGRTLDWFVHFSLSDETAIERMSLRSYCPVCFATYHEKYKPSRVQGICDIDGTTLEKRKDDYPEAIKTRLKNYRANIAPILDYFMKQGKLIEIDASQSIEAIHQEVKDKLGLEKKKG